MKSNKGAAGVFPWRKKKKRKARAERPGFRTVWIGGYDEGQVLDYLAQMQLAFEKERWNYEQQLQKQSQIIAQLREELKCRRE